MSTSSSLPHESPRDSALSWKKEVNERLAAHRTRRDKKESGQAASFSESRSQSAESRAATVAARVAARYANAPTYSELLAQEAQNAARAAAAAADAAREAHEAAQAILQGLDLQPEQPIVRQAAPPVSQISSEPSQQPVITQQVQSPMASFEPKTVLPPPDFVPRQTAPEAMAKPRAAVEQTENTRLSPETAFVEPVESIPGNLIEFPRTLIAANKARPRTAEGPLRERRQANEAEQSQLSIFEVATEASSVAEKEPSLPTRPLAEWSSIQLDAQPSTRAGSGISNSILNELPLATATLEDRLMAGLVDMCLVTLAFLGFVAAFVASTPHLPSGKTALAATGLTFIAFHLLYQYLFFTFSEGTPGMRYARIALCTFDDDNPTRQQMRKRIPATLLSFAAMGMGFLWALFDEDHLGWHDRLTHTYQRSYR